MNMLEYNGYYGTVELSHEDKIFYGKLFGLNDLVTFEGASVKELESSFQEAVDDYLETCLEIGKEPEKLFKGVFNVRIKPELHRKAALEATILGQSLNEFVEGSIAFRIDQMESRPAHKMNKRTEKLKEAFRTDENSSTVRRHVTSGRVVKHNAEIKNHPSDTGSTPKQKVIVRKTGKRK